MKRILLLAGTNYTGESHKLRGCVQDTYKLSSKFGKIGIDDRQILREDDMSKKNWLDLLLKAVLEAQPGDEIYHGHSHHGTWYPDQSEEDGRGEAWVPDDWNYDTQSLITDDEMDEVLAHLHPEAFFIDWPDCCHASGSLRSIAFGNEIPRFVVNPELPEDTGIVRITKTVLPLYRHNVVQLAACRSDQTSADAFIEGEWCGAFTHYALKAWDDAGNISFGNLIDRAGKLLSRFGYSQCPEYVGSESNMERFMLS
ncbi:MAG: hypothetical protein A2020_12160 [Lentisphaerae bacterium GWF2_45_14]|nr:MAG: hypothetical protein A2020_12160 [Lentisphaerae bacterium GWF2_45_14]